MISLRFREFVPGYIGEEFDSMVAQLRSFFSVSFNEDGTLRGFDPGLLTVRVGMIFAYGGAVAPSGYLLCDGTIVSRVTYKALFEVIGVTYGAGDGSTTYHLPDLRERFPYGLATGGALGATGGASGHTHTIPTESAHAHGISSDGGHNHGGSVAADTVNIEGVEFVAPPYVNVSADHHVHTITSDGDHTHGGATGSGGDHSHGGATGAATALPPYITVNYIILAGA